MIVEQNTNKDDWLKGLREIDNRYMAWLEGLVEYRKLLGDFYTRLATRQIDIVITNKDGKEFEIVGINPTLIEIPKQSIKSVIVVSPDGPDDITGTVEPFINKIEISGGLFVGVTLSKNKGSIKIPLNEISSIKIVNLEH